MNGRKIKLNSQQEIMLADLRKRGLWSTGITKWERISPEVSDTRVIKNIHRVIYEQA